MVALESNPGHPCLPPPLASVASTPPRQREQAPSRDKVKQTLSCEARHVVQRGAGAHWKIAFSHLGNLAQNWPYFFFPNDLLSLDMKKSLLGPAWVLSTLQVEPQLLLFLKLSGGLLPLRCGESYRVGFPIPLIHLQGWAHTCHSTHVEVREAPVGASSPLPPRVPWGITRRSTGLMIALVQWDRF